MLRPRSSGPLRVAIADDSGLIYSDDYRSGWVNGFRGVGCEVQVFDITILRKWAIIGQRRSPYSAGSARGLPKQAAQNITAWKPDLVFSHHGRSASQEGFLAEFRKRSIPVAIYLCDEPYETGETAKYSPKFSFVFTMDPCTIEAHRTSRDRHNNVFYLPPGVDTDRFRPTGQERTIPALFLGNATLVPRPNWLKPVDKLVEGADIRFWETVGKGDPRWVPLEHHTVLFNQALVGLNVYRSPWITDRCYKRRVVNRNGVNVPKGLGLPTAQPPEYGTGFWNDANLPAAHVNPRFLEMSACGVCVVSDDTRAEHRRLFPFTPLAEDPAHYLELVLHYVDHPDEAKEIGRACSYLISNRHTYKHRAAEILIRCGFKDQLKGSQFSSLGEPRDWLTPQDWEPQGGRSPLGPTGPSERWSPAFGLSWISGSGRTSGASSLDAPTPWLL